jgi:hypothetical protein
VVAIPLKIRLLRSFHSVHITDARHASCFARTAVVHDVITDRSLFSVSIEDADCSCCDKGHVMKRCAASSGECGLHMTHEGVADQPLRRRLSVVLSLLCSSS